MTNLADDLQASDAMSDDLLTVQVRKTVNASPQQAFAALTEPDLIVQWWGPPGFHSDWAEIDLRPGGAFRIHMAASDGSYDGVLSGSYVIIEPSSRLVFRITEHCNGAPEVFDATKMAPTLVDIELRPTGDGQTHITLTQTGFQDAVAAGAHQGGWTGAFEKFAQAVEARP